MIYIFVVALHLSMAVSCTSQPVLKMKELYYLTQMDRNSQFVFLIQIFMVAFHLSMAGSYTSLIPVLKMKGRY